jgi:hypothetical protein
MRQANAGHFKGTTATGRVQRRGGKLQDGFAATRSGKIRSRGSDREDGRAPVAWEALLLRQRRRGRVRRRRNLPRLPRAAAESPARCHSIRSSVESRRQLPGSDFHRSGNGRDGPDYGHHYAALPRRACVHHPRVRHHVRVHIRRRANRRGHVGRRVPHALSLRVRKRTTRPRHASNSPAACAAAAKRR